MKKLYRSTTEKKVAGVCGGLATYFNVDVSIVRLIWVIASVASANIPGLLIYIVCAMIIPEEPDSIDTTGSFNDDKQ